MSYIRGFTVFINACASEYCQIYLNWDVMFLVPELRPHNIAGLAFIQYALLSRIITLASRGSHGVWNHWQCDFCSTACSGLRQKGYQNYARLHHKEPKCGKFSTSWHIFIHIDLWNLCPKEMFCFLIWRYHIYLIFCCCTLQTVNIPNESTHVFICIKINKIILYL